MLLSNLQDKDVINILDGSVVGKIIDVEINDDGIINKLIVEKYKFILSRFTSHGEIEVLWKNIVKIGEDTILVSFE